MKKTGLTILLIALVVATGVYLTSSAVMGKNNIKWQSVVMPGKLSAAHASLSADCASCHTPAKGVADAKCITCHATNEALLQRQPTAFHAVVGNCATCHTEHQGIDANLKVMNHEALAKIGAEMMGKDNGFLSKANKQHLPADHPNVSSRIAQLNCATCHSTKDKHVGLMGQDCASCHSDKQWTIPEFQHPSVLSINCSQCHQAPPSHYMEHFEMVSKKVAKQEGENIIVTKCFTCHQTTSWNDIKGVGFYDHH
ncbi:MAG TPA: hypothetical protein VMR70_19365 [Flavisolibacter sp.]|nr:hypothetical protein [Flavisolibacter sp.]